MEDVNILFAVEAEHLILNGFFDEAVSLLKKGIEKYPDYPAAYAILAKAYDKSGDSGSAEETINEGIGKFPDNTSIVKTKERLESSKQNEFEEEHTPEDSTEWQEIPENEDSGKHSESDEEEISGNEELSEPDSYPESDEIEHPSADSSETPEILVEETASDAETIETEFEKIDDEDSGADDEDTQSIDEPEQEELISDEQIEFDDSILNDIMEEESEEAGEILPEENTDFDEPSLVEQINEETDTDSIFLPAGFLLEYQEFDKKPDTDRPYNSRNIDTIPGFEFLAGEIESFQTAAPANSFANADITEKDYDNMDEKAKELTTLSKEINESRKKIEESNTEEYDSIQEENNVKKEKPPEIATETMAKILVEQGAFEKAVEIYQKLIDKTPEKAEEYDSRIQELLYKRE